MNTRRTIVTLALSLVVLAPVLPAVAATHFVQQVDMTFSPDVITINAGDTVTWQWSSFSHTVTSGASSSSPGVGSRFDAALNSFNPTFSYTFTTAGSYPYFCRPHEIMGMTGTVIVQNASAADGVPSRTSLDVAGSPNPFNPRTVVSFDLPAAGGVRVLVHDAGGRLVRVLLDGASLPAGRGEAAWDGRDDAGRLVAAGLYVATVESGEARESVKLTLAK